MKCEIFVPKNVYFNTKINILLLLKRKKLILVYLSHFRDHLGGHLGFRGEAEGKWSAPEADLQKNILNYHKMKKKSVSSGISGLRPNGWFCAWTMEFKKHANRDE